MWTRFMDMHSGGGTKEKPYEYIYIEAPEAEAKTIFYNRFGHNPERVTCTCCGEDYSISYDDELEKLTAYDRGCAFDHDADGYAERPRGGRAYMTLDEYRKQPDVLFVSAAEIPAEQRGGDVPQQGYVWIA